MILFSIIKNLFIKNKLKWTINNLQLYIPPISYLNTEESDKYRNMVIKAYKIWGNASGNKLTFNTVDEVYDSCIDIEWTQNYGSYYSNCTFYKTKDNKLYGANIKIWIPEQKENFSDKEIFHSILHSAGASLGVPQTKNTADIMCIPHQFGITELSANDKKAIFNLYNK